MDYVKLKAKVAELLGVDPERASQSMVDECNAATIVEVYDRWASFRTIAAVLTEAEYTTARTILDAACCSSRRAADMVTMLETPGDESGTGGGINFGCDAVRAQLDVLFAEHAEIRGKLKGMAERLVSWADNNDCTGLGAGHIVHVR